MLFLDLPVVLICHPLKDIQDQRFIEVRTPRCVIDLDEYREIPGKQW